MRKGFRIAGAAAWFALIIVMSTSIAFSQTIPNAGFESWSGGAPVGWITNNVLGSLTPLTQVSTAHGGSSAVKGTVVTPLVAQIPYAPVLTSGIFPVSGQPAALHGWYQTSLSGTAPQFQVTVAFENRSGAAVGGGSFVTTSNQSTYKEFVINIYWTGGSADSCALVVMIPPNSQTAIGSYFILDDLSFGAATDVQNATNGLPKIFNLDQNFPNPFNPTTTIKYDIPTSSHVTLKVFNILGDEVATIVDGERSAGSYSATFNGSRLTSGTYFYQLRAGSFVSTKKLLLLK